MTGPERPRPRPGPPRPRVAAGVADDGPAAGDGATPATGDGIAGAVDDGVAGDGMGRAGDEAAGVERDALAGLGGRPVSEHVAVLEAEHDRLQRRLATIDQL